MQKVRSHQKTCGCMKQARSETGQAIRPSKQEGKQPFRLAICPYISKQDVIVCIKSDLSQLVESDRIIVSKGVFIYVIVDL